MKIRILIDCQVVKHTQICCFSGFDTPVDTKLCAGDVMDVKVKHVLAWLPVKE